MIKNWTGTYLLQQFHPSLQLCQGFPLVMVETLWIPGGLDHEDLLELILFHHLKAVMVLHQYYGIGIAPESCQMPRPPDFLHLLKKVCYY